MGSLVAVVRTPDDAPPPYRGRTQHAEIPAWIRKRKLRLFARHVLQTIADLCRHPPFDKHGSLGFVIIGRVKLAKLAGVSPAAVQRNITHLLNRGFLVKVNQGGVVIDTGELAANGYAIPGKSGCLDHMKPTSREATMYGISSQCIAEMQYERESKRNVSQRYTVNTPLTRDDEVNAMDGIIAQFFSESTDAATRCLAPSPSGDCLTEPRTAQAQVDAPVSIGIGSRSGETDDWQAVKKAA